jgi:hypothetical protein
MPFAKTHAKLPQPHAPSVVPAQRSAFRQHKLPPRGLPLPTLSNILPRLLLHRPKLLRLLPIQVPLLHRHINQRLGHALAHPLTPHAEDAPVERVDDEPD